MADQIDEQLSAFGVAQVLVVLDVPAAPASGRASSALEAAVPVKSSRAFAKPAEAVVMALSKFFCTGDLSHDTALAESARFRKAKSAGANWFRKAKAPKDSTPPVRYYPNLGVMLGTVDSAGLRDIRASANVAEVVAPPVPSLVRPVVVEEVAQKGLKRPTYNWGLVRMNVDQVHRLGFTGAGVVVGHLDTGADGSHPALKSAFHAFAEFDDFGFEVQPAPDAPFDTGDHGTHTAGTIAGRTTGNRVIGVAPGAALASAIVIEGGNAVARVLAGMDWVIGKGARILNMSLGFRGYTESFLTLTRLLRSKGVLPVFAVGNEGPGFSRSPGNYTEALSVGASNSDDKVAGFSSSQQFVRPADPIVPDLVAPGVGVISAMPGGGFQKMDGSSMATPHIAGLAALLMEAAPAATVDEIEKAIFDSAFPLVGESADRQSRGMPDGLRALQLLGAPGALETLAIARKPAGKKPAPRKKATRKKRAAASGS